MQHLRSEEKAALLLAEVDDEDDFELTSTAGKPTEENVTVVHKSNKRKTNRRHRNNSSSTVLCFSLIVGSFILGCVSGVVIMLYRISQDGFFQNSTDGNVPNIRNFFETDLTVRNKIFQSIKRENFNKINHSMLDESIAAQQIYEQWKSLPSDVVRINQKSYELKISKFSAPKKSFIEILDESSTKSIGRVDVVTDESSTFISSLVQSGSVDGSTIYYVNYGREEDFAHLITNRINFEDEQSIVLMRRKPSIISVTEQIRQAINYHCSALILFDDDENDQSSVVKQRLSTFEKWRQFKTNEERDQFIDGNTNFFGKKIPVLVFSREQVLKVFSFIETNTKGWPPVPNEWYKDPVAFKLGGKLTNFKIRVTVDLQEVLVQKPVLMSLIKGSTDENHFVLVGYQIKLQRQSKIISELIQSFANQIKQGWRPKRSILFCGWSAQEYDHFTARQWLSENVGLVDRYLIAYLDLGFDIIANTTLNLHGSWLFEQAAHHAADLVASPLVHNHTCHHRQTTTKSTMMNDGNGEHHHQHEHRRKRRDGDHHHHSDSTPTQSNSECEPHKLLDEWMKTTQTSTINIPNIVQTIDPDSSAAIFQLRHGVPSLLIEMTNAEALSQDRFYVRRTISSGVSNIEPDVYVAYTQFVSEIIRQLIDEPLIPFNLTFYAEQIENQTSEYLLRFNNTYFSGLSFHIDTSDQFSLKTTRLAESVRHLQQKIDQVPKNNWILLNDFNKKLIEFERLFIFADSSKASNSDMQKSQHILIGAAIGLTDTSVSFPAMSNILYDMPFDPPTELCDASKLFWIKFSQQIDSVRRALNGIESLFSAIN